MSKDVLYNFNNKSNCLVKMDGRIRKDHSIIYLN